MAAAELLETGGLQAITLRAVGQKIGMTRTTPYRHFVDKEHLLAALATEYFVQLEAAMVNAVNQQQKPLSRLESMMHAYADFVLVNPARYRLMLGREVRYENHPDLYAAVRQVFHRTVEAVTTCQEIDELPKQDASQLAALVFCSVHGLMDIALAGYLTKSKGFDAKELIGLLLTNLKSGA